MQLTSGLVETPEVVVVGAGPTGLMLARELALAGAGVKLLDERTDMPNITRAATRVRRCSSGTARRRPHPSRQLLDAAEVAAAVDRWTRVT
jgi:2-polyprenyl-6-methoxyphenol hydroxylase-like FAD-dependent oxidoreductase